jgi:hypothetical protein
MATFLTSTPNNNTVLVSHPTSFAVGEIAPVLIWYEADANCISLKDITFFNV